MPFDCSKNAFFQGLGEAHRQGLIHRDIKPGNILIEASSGRALLADFGLVHHVGQADRLTVSGTIMGTVDYIVRQNKPAGKLSINARISIRLAYCFINYWPAVCHSRPTRSWAMLYQHTYEQPFPLQQAAPDLPEPLVAIVARLLAKKPEDRYQDCESILVDVAAFREGQSNSTLSHSDSTFGSAPVSKFPNGSQLPVHAPAVQQHNRIARAKKRRKAAFA